MAGTTTAEGSDTGVAWHVTVESTDIDMISLVLQIGQPVPHRARFVAASAFGSGPDGDIFSTWPVGCNGHRWVIVVLSADVHNTTLRHDGVQRSISPARIATSRIPQLGIFSVTDHPAELDLYDDRANLIGTLHLYDPRVRRDGQPRDHTAPAPIGPLTQMLGRPF